MATKFLAAAAMAVLLAGGVTTTVQAQTITHIGPAYTVPITGMGNESCGSWTSERHHFSVAGTMQQQWVLGFLTAMGVGENRSRPLNGIDAEGVWGWFDNYCRANPTRKLFDAGLMFTNDHWR
jgi:hypothetical protein